MPGPGGYVAAIRAAQLGMRVACVEKDARARRHLPERRLHPEQGAARFVASTTSPCADGLAAHGIKVGGVELDLPAMMARKDKVVNGLTRGIAGLFKKNKIDARRGRARRLRRRRPRRGARRCRDAPDSSARAS